MSRSASPIQQGDGDAAPVEDSSASASAPSAAASAPVAVSASAPVAVSPAPNSTGLVSAVSIKLPPYWTAHPQLWFCQVESLFSTRGMRADSSRFHHVVAALPPEVALVVSDFLMHPPGNGRYEGLKKTLIQRTTASSQKRLRQLLTSEELGDRKPSQLLRNMRRLLGETQPADESLLGELFLQHLPTNVQAILASARIDTLEEQATMADKIMEVVPSSLPFIAAVDVPPRETALPRDAAIPQNVAAPSCDAAIRVLTAELAALRKDISTLKKQFRPPRLRSHSHSRQTTGVGASSTSSTVSTDSGLCFYHAKYAEKARYCTQPCTYQKEPGN